MEFKNSNDDIYAIFKILSKQELTFPEYLDKMMDFMEYMEYSHWVLTFRPEDVAKSLHGATLKMYLAGMSFRMAGLVNFSLTMKYQLMRDNEVKH